MHIYRHILKEALVTAWTRKELWFFGLFAAFLNTGSLLDTLARTFRHTISVGSIQEAWVSAIPGLPTGIAYFQTFFLLPEERRLLLVSIFFIATTAFVLLSVNGQANLFHHLKHKSRSIRWWHPSPLLLGRLLLLNVFTRFVLMGFSGLAGTLLATLHTTDASINALVMFATLVLFIPLGLLIGAVSLLATAEITLKKKTLPTSVVDAWEIIRHHGVATLELSLLLFLTGLLGTLVFIAILMVLAVPYLILVLVSLLTNSALLWALLTLLGAGLMLFLVLLFGGFMTSFVYTTWYLVYQKFALRSAVVSKLERFFCVQRSPLH